MVVLHFLHFVIAFCSLFAELHSIRYNHTYTSYLYKRPSSYGIEWKNGDTVRCPCGFCYIMTALVEKSPTDVRLTGSQVHLQDWSVFA